MFWRGVLVGVLSWFFLPAGLIGMWLLLRHILRSHGEAPRSVSEMVRATDIAPGTIAEPRRPREREAWTQIEDYVHEVY